MFGDTELWFVDTQEGLERAARELSKAKVIGVDTEGDSFHHYKEKTCLIQFSDIERDYMVDPLTVDDISILGDIMVDPKIVKIFHGVDYDVMCMNRDFGFEFRNLFDTMIAAQMAGHQKIGLADLINDYFGITIDKKYQRHDWAKRPLLQEHIEYARGDTHYILAIREFLIRELKEVGRLGHLTEECKILEGRRYVPKIAQEHAWLGTKRANHLDPQELNVLKHVWRYRASEAERADRPTFKVFADPILVKIAENQPETLDDLDRLFSGMHGMKRRYGKGIVSAVRAGQDDESPIPKPQKPKKPRGPKPRLTGRTAERAHEALKAWRNKLTKAHNDLSPVTVASNTVLKRIASARPTTIDELRDVQDVRNWQVNDFGEEILAVLDKVAPMGGEDNGDDGDDAPKASRPRKRRRKPKASED